LRRATDTSVRSLRGLSETVDLPLLAATYVDRSGPADLVPTRDAPTSPTAESMRRLRTTLQFLDVDNPPHVLAVASTEPGEGKTTVACDLALALAVAGGRVLLVEADLRRPSIAGRLGLERTVGLTSVLAGQVELVDAVQRTTFGADVLTSGALVPTPGELLASRRMRAVLTEARAHYDHVVVDTAPVLTVGDTSALLPLVDGVLLLCRWRSTSTVRLALSVQLMRSVSARTLGVVLTFVPARFAPEGEGGYGDLPTGPSVVGGPTTPATPAAPQAAPPRPAPEVRHAATLQRKASHGR
jgi:capsular exopolysaccharide synthesis family protein